MPKSKRKIVELQAVAISKFLLARSHMSEEGSL